MAYTYAHSYWIRTVKETRTLIQIFSSSSGKEKYIESDGKKLMEIQPENKLVEVIEQFRRLTPIEQHILEAKHPELWNDKTED